MDAVERVARAICEASGTIWGGPRGEDDPDFVVPKIAYMSMARAAIEAMPGWQPIETAPKNGTDVLIFRAQGGRKQLPPIVAGWFRGNGGGGWSSFDDPDKWIDGTATHWMPLPTRPSSP